VTHADAEARWPLRAPLDVHRTLGVHRRGRGDPTWRDAPGGVVWRTCRPAAGPATLRITVETGEVTVAAWGPGADWAVAAAPRWLGEDEPAWSFEPEHPLLRTSRARNAGWRVSASGLVLEALVPAVLEQKVTGGEARRSWRRLVERYGDPAPGPAPPGLRVVPAPARWRRVPSWAWHEAGVGPQRSATVLRAVAVARRLEEAAAMDWPDAERRLRAVPGIGAWTAAEVMQRAAGALDAISVGDAHLPRLVVHALTGEVRDDDASMLAILEPYRPQRYRVQRLVELSGHTAPAFGPRYAPLDHRRR
jgi:hypothetical protein